MIFVKIFLLSLLVGCSTVTPNHIKDDRASSDSSTPPQEEYLGKGWILYQLPNHDGILTHNGAELYKSLIECYGVQFKGEKHYSLSNSDLIPYVDQYGNDLWRLPSQYLEAFDLLGVWAKDHRAKDTVLSKMLDKATP